MEVWKDVVGYDGMYQVSNLGRVRRIFKNGAEHILIGKKDKDGYREVLLSRNQQKKYFRLHRLVAEAFIPNPENKPQVNHKDKNVQNNVVNPCDIHGESTNLEWVTQSENVVHSFRMGRKTHKRPIIQYTKEMNPVAEWDSIRDASLALNVRENNISACCSGMLKTAYGYVWRYKESV